MSILNSISSPTSMAIICYPWVCSVNTILPTSSNLQRRSPTDYHASSLWKHWQAFWISGKNFMRTQRLFRIESKVSLPVSGNLRLARMNSTFSSSSWNLSRKNCSTTITNNNGHTPSDNRLTSYEIFSKYFQHSLSLLKTFVTKLNVYI